MANFALILPRPEMVAQAGRIARQLGMTRRSPSRKMMSASLPG